MSLHLVVGQLAYCVASSDEEAISRATERFERVNEALRKAGLPEHQEPRHLKGRESWSCGMGVTDLWRLRRLAAHIRVEFLEADCNLDRVEHWPAPLDDRVVQARDTVLDAYYETGAELWDHLFYHSDFEGFYVPIDMEEVLVPLDDELRGAVGGIIGSSQWLLGDCKDVAGLIGLPLDLEPDWKTYDDMLARESKGGQGWWMYPFECMALLKLYNAARKSLELGAAIVFHG
jgi:hypothetical protein